MVALVLTLAVVTPALAHQSSYSGPVVLESAHPDLTQGQLTLRGYFGLRALTVWLGDDRLDIVRHKTDEVVVLLPNHIAPGTYNVTVARSRLANQFDSMSVAIVPAGGSGGGTGAPGPRGPAGPQGSGFLYRTPTGIRHPFPPGIDWTSWPSGRNQWTFMLRNATQGGYTDSVDAGVVCANAN